MTGDKPPSDAKLQSLRAQGCLNRRPEAVSDLLFREDDFFDPHDLVQVKYEMLRRVRREGLPVSRASATFGFSRPAYYQAQFAFEQEGLPGLVPKKRGPRGGHKLTEEVLEFVAQERAKDDSVRASVLADLVARRFGVKVHPRSVERALERLKKNMSERCAATSRVRRGHGRAVRRSAAFWAPRWRRAGTSFVDQPWYDGMDRGVGELCAAYRSGGARHVRQRLALPGWFEPRRHSSGGHTRGSSTGSGRDGSGGGQWEMTT